MSVKKKSKKIPVIIIILVVLLVVGGVVGIVLGILLGGKKGDKSGGYFCNVATGKCEKGPSGIYKTLEECQSKGCKTIPVSDRYSCNTSTGSCSKDINGKMSESDCNSGCKVPPPPPKKCKSDTDCEPCNKCEGGVCTNLCKPNEICNNGKCEIPIPNLNIDCLEAPWNPYDTETGDVNSRVFQTVPKIVPDDHFGRGLNGIQSNWIGPFSHAGGQTSNDPYAEPTTQSGPDGDNWGGGSQWYNGWHHGNKQIYPFPMYYYARFLGALNGNTGKYDSEHQENWKVCPLTDIPQDTEKGNPPIISPDGIKCINDNIIKPAIIAAIEIANEARKDLETNKIYGKYFSKIPDLKIEDLTSYTPDKSTGLLGIKPSANSANALYNFYSTNSPTGVKEIQQSYEDAILNCPAAPVTSGQLAVPIIDIAKAWMTSTGGKKENLQELYEQRFRDCPASLITIAGETTCICKDTSDPTTMTCENPQSSGVWQITSPDDAPISSGCANFPGPKKKDCVEKSTICNKEIMKTNLCCQADWVNTHLYTNASANISSFGMFNYGYGNCGWAPPGEQRYCSNPNKEPGPEKIPCKGEDPKPSPGDKGSCKECYPGSSGQCKNHSNNVCFPLVGGICPGGTIKCQ
jgi:hypothetical protein